MSDSGLKWIEPRSSTRSSVLLMSSRRASQRTRLSPLERRQVGGLGDEAKLSAVGEVLQKFFDNEREDYKKDVAMKTPNYDALQKKSSQVPLGTL